MSLITQHYPALASPGYRRYWLGSFASVGGTQLITLGQAWLVFELSGSALTLGYLGLAAALGRSECGMCCWWLPSIP